MSRREVSNPEQLIKTALKDLRVYVSILENQHRMPTREELDVVVNMVSRCMEHVKVTESNIMDNDGCESSLYWKDLPDGCMERKRKRTVWFNEGLESCHEEGSIMCDSSSSMMQLEQYGLSKHCVSSKEPASAFLFQGSELDSSNNNDAAVDWDEEEDPSPVDPVPQPLRNSSRQSRQGTDSAEEGESHYTFDPVPRSHRLSSSRQSRQGTDSAEEGGSLCSVDPVPQPLRRSSRQSRQSMNYAEGKRYPIADRARQRRSTVSVHCERAPARGLGNERWTPAMDAHLLEAMAQYRAQGWARVAECMEDGLSARQCHSRWYSYLEPHQRGLKSGNWQPHEEERLLELVILIPSYWSKYRKAECTDWKAIGEELGRVPMDCRNKYIQLQNNQLKKGPFTAEEDALIYQRVEEWGDKGNGLWVVLEKEMDRPGSVIGQRWHKTLSKRKLY